jgi:hypothetical protein
MTEALSFGPADHGIAWAAGQKKKTTVMTSWGVRSRYGRTLFGKMTRRRISGSPARGTSEP